MSQLSQLLIDKAEEIRLSSETEVAVDLLKQAGFSEEDARLSVAQHTMEKEACNSLVQAGVDIEQAVAMVKAANINLKDMTSFSTEVEAHPSIELLIKAAQYIEALEAEIEGHKEDLEKAASAQTISEVVLPENITKAASSGMFTNEDLAVMQSMDQEVLIKLASVMDAPVEMGRGSGFARPKTDAMLEFILG